MTQPRDLQPSPLCVLTWLGLTPPVPAVPHGQVPVIVCGRICPEEGGRLTRGTILLEGSRRGSNGARVLVDVRELRAYSLFPGQVVAIQGMCTTGTRLVAQRVIEVGAVSARLWKCRRLRAVRHRHFPSRVRVARAALCVCEQGVFPKVLRGQPDALRAAKTLRMWSASGPFTLASDLNYKVGGRTRRAVVTSSLRALLRDVCLVLTAARAFAHVALPLGCPLTSERSL